MRNRRGVDAPAVSKFRQAAGRRAGWPDIEPTPAPDRPRPVFQNGKNNSHAYLLDRDPGVDVLIDAIEEAIRSAITTDNPNVWYELGFAFAAGRPVVMVCSQPKTVIPQQRWGCGMAWRGCCEGVA